MRSRDEVQAMVGRVLQGAEADEVEVRYTAEHTSSTRFGENAITQNSVCDDERLTVELTFGRRRGSASTNRVDDPRALEAVVARATVTALQSAEDPELVALPGPQVYGDRPPAWFPETAALSPEAVADDVAQIVGPAARAGFRASGLFQVLRTCCGIANARGLFGWDAATAAEYSATIHGPSGSSKAAAAESDRARIDVGELARAAVEDARQAQDPQPVDPGDYTVIFEPLAVRGLLAFLQWALDARDADEGSSVFSGTVGQQLVGSIVTIGLDTDDPVLPAPTMGRHGRAIRATRWIEDGVVRRLAHDPFWAAHKGTEPDPARSPLYVSGGSGTVADLIAGCERGLLVKDLWYIRNVDWRTATLTGMTRDGVFRVERGRVVGPVRNLRWNESPITFLKNVVALSRPVRTGGRGSMKVPGAMSEGFTFTSVTDSV